METHVQEKQQQQQQQQQQNGDEQEDIRYPRLLRAIDKCLLESRDRFDTQKAILECYGEDGAVVFGGNHVLVGVLEGMMDKMHETVTMEMKKFVSEGQPRRRLERVEGIVRRLDRIDQHHKALDLQDRQSAQQALEQTKLPEGIRPMDIVTYHAHQTMTKEHERLVQEIARVETETQRLQEEVTKAEALVEEGMESLENTQKELGRTADVCSTVS